MKMQPKSEFSTKHRIFGATNLCKPRKIYTTACTKYIVPQDSCDIDDKSDNSDSSHYFIRTRLARVAERAEKWEQRFHASIIMQVCGRPWVCAVLAVVWSCVSNFVLRGVVSHSGAADEA